MSAEQGPAVYEAIEAATFDHDGITYSIVPGTPGTTFAAGHPVVRARPDLFKPFTPSYPWAGEDAAAPRNTSRPDQRGARTR